MAKFLTAVVVVWFVAAIAYTTFSCSWAASEWLCGPARSTKERVVWWIVFMTILPVSSWLVTTFVGLAMTAGSGAYDAITQWNKKRDIQK